MTRATRRLSLAAGLAAALLARTPLTAAEPLSVGVAVEEITPPLGYPMAGYFSERGATGTLDPLYAKAIVFRQGKTAAAIVVGDLVSIDARLGDAVRGKVEAATGIPAGNVVVAATHSHTGPDYKGKLPAGLDPNAPRDPADAAAGYVPFLVNAMAAAVTRAAKSAEPATLRVGAGHEETVAFNRRFLLKDGTVRTWARLSNPDVVKAAGPIDPSVGLLAVYPAGGEPKERPAPSAAVVNYALHCDTVGGSQYSGDFPAHMERVLRKTLGPGFTSVFAQGTCGDINHSDPTGAPRRTAAEIGERLAAAAAEAVSDLEPVATDLAVRRAVIELPLQTYTDEELKAAEDLIARHKAGEKFPTAVAAQAYKVRRLHRLRTGNADLGRGTDEVIASAEGPRTSLPAEVQVIRFGPNAALVTLPGEIFVDLGLAIKQASPFANTLVMELANDSPAYVPTREAMKQGGYEAANSIYAPGGGEKLVETAVGLLKELGPKESR